MPDLADFPFKEVNFPARDIRVKRRDNGEIIMESLVPVRLRASTLPAYLRKHAELRPDAIFIAQRRPRDGDWLKVTYSAFWSKACALAQALRELNLPPDRPLAVLSGNSIENALITLAAMQAGIVVAPVSEAYSLQSKDFSKLRCVWSLVKPGAVFVQDGAMFGPALAAVCSSDLAVIAVKNVQQSQLEFVRLCAIEPGEEIGHLVDKLDPEAPAKYMFTSGSTGQPKAVIQSHFNICFSAECLQASFGETEEGVMVRLDWTPWSHVFGATSLAMALIAGGTFYLDDGRPVGPLFQETVRNLKEVSPTAFATVPVAYATLADALEADEAFANRFFSGLTKLGYAGARLPDDLAERMQRLAVKCTGHRLSFTSGYGSTETGPAGASVYWYTTQVGFVGLPQPDHSFKLVPIDGDRFEVRLKGGGVTSGYLGNPEMTAKIFDEEGFYKTGDAATFVDVDRPLDGLIFAGRLSEEFKLQTGSFVLVSSLRVKLVEATAPLVRDVVICGENERFIAIMAWLDLDAARNFCGRPDAGLAELNRDPSIIAALAKKLSVYNDANPASSTSVRRFLLLDELPSIDAGEITDKGSINQRGTQINRADLVSSLFSDPHGEAVHDLNSTSESKVG